jgi:RimJ/RimL family protein N-acetyltransferase
MFDPFRCIVTGRLLLRPVWGGDLPDLVALKADPRAFGMLLGGVRDRQRATEELAEDIAFWGRHRVGMWTARDRTGGALVGLTGIMLRADGRGMALRFTLRPDCLGRGYASEAAGAALRFAHERAGLRRVVAVARETNTGSREVLGAIGMREAETFVQHDHRMVLYESVWQQAA